MIFFLTKDLMIGSLQVINVVYISSYVRFQVGALDELINKDDMTLETLGILAMTIECTIVTTNTKTTWITIRG